MIAHVPTGTGSVASDKEFYARFVDLRLSLKALGAEIVSVHHANHWVDVDWLPRGASQDAEPNRSTIFRLVPDLEVHEASDLMIVANEAADMMRLAA